MVRPPLRTHLGCPHHPRQDAQPTEVLGHMSMKTRKMPQSVFVEHSLCPELRVGASPALMRALFTVTH